MRRLRPVEVGWRLGDAREPRGGQLWVPWDRTAGVIGPQGSGKTLDLLAPALIDAPGAALTTLTKVDDLLLTFTARSTRQRPCIVLDPFGLVPGLPEVVWDPIQGCVDPLVAERRAKAFTAGTVKGAVAGGHADDAARFYAAEAAKVLQGYFHAAALTGRSLEHVLSWVAKPLAATDPTEILREHPHAATFWDGLLYGALHGDDRTAGNTITTVQQAMSLFFQEDIRRRCVPGPHRAATDIAHVIAQWRHHLPARPRRPLRLRLTADDGIRRARPGHRPAGREHLAVGAAVPTLPRDPRRAALDRTVADPAHPHGQRTRPGDLVHVGRAGLATARRDLRGAGSPHPRRLDQQPHRVRRLQGRRVQPGDLRPARRGPGLPRGLADRADGRTAGHGRRHSHPDRCRGAPTQGTSRPRALRERRAHHRPPAPMHRRQARAAAAGRPGATARSTVGADRRRAVSAEARAAWQPWSRPADAA
jgi:hypothetical protein